MATLRRRAGCQGWVTRAANKLEELLKKDDVNLIELRDAADEFDKRIASLDEAQADVELEIEEEKDLLADINVAGEFRESKRAIRIRAARKLHELDKTTASASVSSVDVKLPKLSLPSFGGDVLEWPSFWDQFVATVDASDLPVVSKFSYLLSLLKGEAKQAVQGLSMTSKHYDAACKILKDRYGRKERIIFTHIQKLLNITIPAKCSVSVLWKLSDDLLAHTRSLEALGIDGDQYGVILTPLVLSRLPQDIRLEWSRDGEGHESDLGFLLTFLEKEIQRRERSQVFKETVANSNVGVSEERRGKVATASALQSSSKSEAPNCGICHKTHTTERCFKLLKLPIPERREKLRSVGLCFRCLASGHISKGCSASCRQCRGRHHFILCNPPKPNTVEKSAPSNDASTVAGSGAAVSSNPAPAEAVSHTGISAINTGSPGNYSHVRSRVLLQTAWVKVRGNGGTAMANVLFDSGSNRSYITSDLVRKLGAEWVDSEPVSYAAFGTADPSLNEMRNIYNVILHGSNDIGHSLRATEIPVISAPLFRPAVPDDILTSLGDLQFTASHITDQNLNIDILIGLDSCWKFVGSEIRNSIPEGLMAQSSVFGWILYGSVPHAPAVEGVAVSHQLLCLNVSDRSVRAFWDLESIGIQTSDETIVSDPVLTKFNDTLRQVNGRYEVSLPWKTDFHGKLLNNEKLARARLTSLNKRLARDPTLSERYHDVIEDLHKAGIVEQVPDSEPPKPGPVFYLPHRPVVRESAVSTKVRPVFDASAKGYNGVSLNDCMEIGPCLLANLTEILLRFRRWDVALTADIEKAFLQIAVRESDRDVHRFLWQSADEIKTMRFTRVPFGNCSSPFLLNATVQSHLSTFPRSRIVEELQQNMYVDDFISGADSVEECCDMVKGACDIMSQASMPLVKWGSNRPEVAETLPHEFQDKFLQSDSIKVLGMKWLASCDCFVFHGVPVPDGLCITKRVVLSFFSRLFDPLGFSAPFIMQAKCLFQELWALGLHWDDELPADYQMQFLSWIEGLAVLQKWKIPRNYTGQRWSDIRSLQLHGFSDASPKGYGACVYMRAEMFDGSVSISLVIAKARVAPLKRLTLPRLELLGCLLCARLITFVKNALLLPDSVELFCWTDSTIALSWVKSSPGKWKTFVANRTTEIQTLIHPDSWSHCPGVENPADLLTRGISADELVHSPCWLQGPQFLKEDSGPNVQPEKCSEVLCVIASEEAVNTPTTTTTCASGEPIFPVERWSTFTKAMRVVAYVRRFVNNMRKSRSERQIDDLTFQELQDAKHALIKEVQKHAFANELSALNQERPIAKNSSLAKLSPFVDDSGLLRVQGRLQFSALSWSEKHPMILPKGHLAKLLTRFHHRFLKHAGVSAVISSLRNEFWILGVRRIAKQVKKECVACQRQDCPPCSQPMAPLPSERVKQSNPFAVLGVDYAGPLFCADFPQKKFWILLFTCAVTRAVHLELVSSLSTAETLLALRRLAARRGLPQIIFSDNAKGFTASPQQLQKQFGHAAPEWRFIAPRSPWWGGWWERLIRSVKLALRKSLGSNCLAYRELETMIHEVEACINSRPLTFVSDEISGENPLTPAHFLLGHGSGFFGRDVPPTPLASERDLGQRYDLRQSMLDRFWSLWSSDYIRNLPPHTGCRGNCGIRVGSLVLVQDDQPRLKWPLGVITKVFPGRDGVIRTVEVKTSAGTLIRSIPRIHDLEIMSRELGSVPLTTEPLGLGTLANNQNTPVSSPGSLGSLPNASLTDPFVPILTDPSIPIPSDASPEPSVSIPLEPPESADKSTDNDISSGSHGSEPYITRRGRVVKPLNRLDL